MDWRAIDPTIFGTLFERGLDPAARAPLGAHYTDTGTIAKLIHAARQRTARRRMGRTSETPYWRTFPAARRAGRARLPGRPTKASCSASTTSACSTPPAAAATSSTSPSRPCATSKNAPTSTPTELGLQPELTMQTGPHNILGLEINEFAAELARVTVWIGDIQWCRRNGYPHALNPILKPLDGIEHRDALLNPDGSEAEWPAADVIVGNPPFLGDKVMRSELGDDYVQTLRQTYDGRVPGGADLVTYWFEKARAQIAAGKLQAAGLVSTNSIRGGANRKVLERICDTTRIFEAWSDEAWVNEGAAVRVSLVGFGPIFGADRSIRLDGAKVASIHADLTADIDVTKTPKILENLGKSFQGVTPSASVNKKLREQLGLPEASFNLEGNLARKMLKEPATMIGEPMAAVVRPYLIADDITTRPLDRLYRQFRWPR